LGVGEQIRGALRAGATRVIVGVGGTGTNDGGAGAVQALGYRLLDRKGRELAAGPLQLEALERIDASSTAPELAQAEVRVAVDVRNRLLGPEGATAVYGPQKGVGPELGEVLERALARWAAIVERDLGVHIASVEGGGAGGGLAAGLVAACGASVESGAALVAEAIGLPALIEACDVVVTGEGRLDAQSSYGKTVAHVAELAAARGRPCLVVAGSIEELPSHVLDAEAVAGDVPLAEAMARAAELVSAAAEQLALRHRGLVARS
jgi:glycerate kinase